MISDYQYFLKHNKNQEMIKPLTTNVPHHIENIGR